MTTDMKPPGTLSSAAMGSPAASFRLDVMKKRSDFLTCAKGRRASAPGLNLQGRNRGDGGPVRVGFTATKKVGNAVARNRAKRRLRAVAAEVLKTDGKTGWDYVLVARPETTVRRDWTALIQDLKRTLGKVHGS